MLGQSRWNECKNKPHYFEMFLKESQTGSYERNKALSLQKTPEKKSPCTHLGEENGRIECPSCSGTVKVKTFDCAVHGSCTLGKALDGAACCVGCADYREVQEVPFQGPGNHA